MLELVQQRLKPMNTKVLLKRDLTISVSPGGKAAGRIRRGERAIILETDDVKWCHIRSDSGREGWFQVEGCCIVDGRNPGEVFDGLCFAD